MNRTIACVLKSGGIYDRRWVERLYRGVCNHISGDYNFVCLTDMNTNIPGVIDIRLECGLPGWWSKMELFRPNLFNGTVLYFDLDTIVTGNLDIVFNYPHRFTMAHEFYRPEHYCSTAMAWDGRERFGLLESFLLNSCSIIKDFDRRRSDRLIGDQAFIERHMDDIGLTIDTFKRLYGERFIASYKVHNCSARPPSEAIAVAFHGKPKPHEVQSGWVAKYWNSSKEVA